MVEEPITPLPLCPHSDPIGTEKMPAPKIAKLPGLAEAEIETL